MRAPLHMNYVHVIATHLCTKLWSVIAGTYTVKRAALAFECINHIKRRDRLALCMLCVCDRVPDDALKKQLENATRFIVNQAGNTLHTTTTCKTTDRRLGDTLDVVAQNLAMAFSTALSKTFAALPRKSLLTILCRLQVSMHLYVRPLIMVVASVASVSV